jgi:hypothetical protein
VCGETTEGTGVSDILTKTAGTGELLTASVFTTHPIGAGDGIADDFDDGLRVDGDRADRVFDEQPFFDDKRSIAPVVLGGFLHVGEVSLCR